ncbi:hypothetical protein [Thalassotalea crassostreae]|uniref:hypothetical protein n=1 Tax=Thalassotalea crassostreae TaxID=1763536 RepID=UPI0008393BC3|nr:hypothetical protein [Thalassotalea crassostreae]
MKIVPKTTDAKKIIHHIPRDIADAIKNDVYQKQRTLPALSDIEQELSYAQVVVNVIFTGEKETPYQLLIPNKLLNDLLSLPEPHTYSVHINVIEIENEHEWTELCNFLLHTLPSLKIRETKHLKRSISARIALMKKYQTFALTDSFIADLMDCDRSNVHPRKSLKKVESKR